MCARFRSVAEIEYLVSLYDAKQLRNFEYNPNVAPTDAVPIIRSSHSEEKKLEIARFGLVHPWAKDTKSAAKYINARSETINEKPAYRNAYDKRRCVIPAQGFYEWMEEDGKKFRIWFTGKTMASCHSPEFGNSRN